MAAGRALQASLALSFSRSRSRSRSLSVLIGGTPRATPSEPGPQLTRSAAVRQRRQQASHRHRSRSLSLDSEVYEILEHLGDGVSSERERERACRGATAATTATQDTSTVWGGWHLEPPPQSEESRGRRGAPRGAADAARSSVSVAIKIEAKSDEATAAPALSPPVWGRRARSRNPPHCANARALRDCRAGCGRRSRSCGSSGICRPFTGDAHQ